MISRVKFVSIPFVDQDRALAFWRDKAGFKVATDQPFDESQRWIELKIPGADTLVVLFAAKGHAPGFFSGGFWCENAQKTHDEMKARGVEFAQPPKTEVWGTSAIFKDTEGNSFVLSSK